jgi:O-antigen/teichoic acid export membrane protein
MRFIRFSIIELSRTLLIAIGVSMAILIYGHSMTAWQVLSIQGAAMLSLFAIVFKRRLDFGNLFNFRHARELLSVILRGNYRFLFSYFFLYSFFAQIDIFMLRTLSGDLSLATYGSAFRYYALIVLLLGSVHTVFLPTTQKIGNVVELNRLFKKYMKLVLLVAPVILVGAWASQWIIPWIDTGKYPQAVSVFRILAVSAILSIAFSPYVNVIMKFEHFRFLFGLIITAIALSVGLNLVLVPQLGAVGTAISTLISFAFVNGSTFVRARRVMRTRISELQLARAVGAKKTGAGAVLQIRGSQQSNLEKIHETKAISNKAQTEVERVGA